MSQIEVMSSHLSNLIAAGEVVERPLNIVKECVENAIDAGANRIEIDLKSGGIEEIIVTDNGSGMDYEDTAMAFKRHATSKLKSQDDLFSIATMGFRGEALPSIASVAHVELSSNNGSESSVIEIGFGQVIRHERSDSPLGTRITIRELFTHTPARFKYLKKASYEYSLIADCINKFALAYPEISFVLRHDNRIGFQSRGNGKTSELIYQLFGRDAAKSADFFKGVSDDYNIEGFFLAPEHSRSNPYSIYISLNQRIIRSSTLYKAVTKAFGEYMPKGRYPIACLRIQCDPQLVDVNVHPGKWQIRFAKEEALTHLVQESIRQALHKRFEAPDIPEIKKNETGPVPVDQNPAFTKQPEDVPSSINYPNGNPFVLQPGATDIKPSEKETSDLKVPESEIPGTENPGFFQSETSLNQQENPFESFQSPDDSLENLQEKERAAQSRWFNDYPDFYEDKPEPEPKQKKDYVESTRLFGEEHSFFDELVLIGQLRDSYILCENKEGLVIIDQHAAQERYHFELLVKLLNEPPVLQPLMVPILIHAPALIHQVDQLNAYCKPYGLEFDVFSDHQLILRQEPLWFSKLDKKPFLDELLDYFIQNQNVDMLDLRRHVIATMACHQSIRFHHKLTFSEMQEVIDDLKKCEQPYHCPHGRPVLITLKEKQLISEFMR